MEAVRMAAPATHPAGQQRLVHMSDTLSCEACHDAPHVHRIGLCLGAHRSGTSLVAAAIEAVGANLGLPDRETSEENAKGFFEHTKIVRINEAILEMADSAWDDALFDGSKLSVFSEHNLGPLRAEVLSLVNEHFVPAQLSAIKDPRICRLLPFWFSILTSAGYTNDNIRCILVTRDPVEVALSQRTRCRNNSDYYDFGTSLVEGVALWLNHIQQLLRDCAGRDILVISYPDFMRRPAHLLDRLACFLGSNPTPADLERFVREFVSPDLWRSHPDTVAIAEIEMAFPGLRDAESGLAALSGRVVGDAELAPFRKALGETVLHNKIQQVVGQAYGRLAGQRRKERQSALATADLLRVTQDARDAVERSRSEILAETSDLEAHLRDTIDEITQVVDARDGQLEQAQRDIEYLQQLNTAIRASRSWRLTKPLRYASTMLYKTRALPKRGLSAINRVASLTYRRLKRSNPRTADLIRRSVLPLLTRMNLRVFGQHRLLTTSTAQPAASFALAYQQIDDQGAYTPFVTIIVPNYNHSPYLARRLDSLLAQTYANFEIILLDDNSTDDSQTVLSDYAARHPEQIRCFFNADNSGSVFKQWESGLSRAQGELVWIAESDDWADPNFLSTLVPFFQNDAVQLAYGRTVFMNSSGDTQVWSMEEYLADFNPERWSHAWVETAPDIVRAAFSMINIIPNVSSAIFRNFDHLDNLEIDRWRTMRTCGDWMFYLNAIRGGMIAYSPAALSYYRIHDKNTSVTSHTTDRFYEEHEDVAECLLRHYNFPASNLQRLENRLRDHWTVSRDDFTDDRFNRCFNRGRILNGHRRAPGVLMVGFAFCAGGGETFPIQLANELKAIGYEVTFLDCAQAERLPGIRNRLANDIPVVSDFHDLRDIVSRFDIEIIHSHHGWADNTVLDILPASDNYKTVITLHGFYETLPEKQLQALLPRLLKRTGAFAYVAEKNVTALQPAGKRVTAARFERIDNAVSVSQHPPFDRASLGIKPDAFVMVLVSRAIHEKGWKEAIAGTTLARERSGRDIHLILAGEGEARDAAEAAGVPDYVHLVGFQQHPQSYFASADLGLLPSRFPGESFPLVVIESLVAGTPVLASNVGAVREMLSTPKGPAGVIFELENWQIDIRLLADIIADLATNASKVAALKERALVAAQKFDPRQMARMYDTLYRSVTQATKPTDG